MEIWKRIEGGKNAYVSDKGHVMQDGKIKEPHYDTEGYQRVSVRGVGRDRVHKFVAKEFVPNPDNKPMVDHQNNRKDDNRASNLQWVTAKENAVKAGKDGLCSGDHRRKRIAGIKMGGDHKVVRMFRNQKEAERETGVSSKDINKCLQNKRNTAGGYVFGYME